MDEINRRALMGAAGATVALTACSPTNKDSGNNEAKSVSFDTESLRSWKATYSPLGTGIPNDDHGIQNSNNGKRKFPRGAKSDNFKAEYFCLVYIKFSENKINIRHAYFDITTDVKKQFANLSIGKSWDSPYGGKEFLNFDSFNFGSPQMIYMYVDNDSVEFDSENLIQMTFFGPRKDKPGNPRIKNVNNSFLNPEIDSIIWPGKKILKIENWFYGKNGKKIDKADEKQWEYYSMNIHLLMKTFSAGGDYGNIPIIIDPDGSNMGSAP